MMHTLGPWRVEKIGSIEPWTDALSIAATDEFGNEIHVAHTTRGFEGAFLPNGEHDETSCAWANARLIAAAPDLLQALAALLGAHVELVAGGDCGSWDVETDDVVIVARAAIAKATG